MPKERPTLTTAATFTLFNETGRARWTVNVVLLGDEANSFGVQEDEPDDSLFSYPYANGASLSRPGATVAEALSNFLAVETDLINSL